MNRMRKKWPALFFLVLAAVPLAVMMFIIINLVLRSSLAVESVGFGNLFGTQISGVFSWDNSGQYGLLPALWGTLLLIIVCMGVAIPVSLAMAIFSSEFTLGFVGKGMGMILGILGGIPSIVYALMSITFAQVFMIPKFTGAGIPVSQLPIPVGQLPFNTSTLLGGIMLSMLIVPFLAPLFADAISDAPVSQKEASLGLGASRWHTLWNVTIPHALPGIFSATSLGTLKAMGDVIIVGLVIGFVSPLPNPLFDVLKSIAPLTSTGAGFSGGFSQSSKSPLRDSVAYFSALLLLIIALGFLVVVPIFQRRLKRRLSQ